MFSGRQLRLAVFGLLWGLAAVSQPMLAAEPVAPPGTAQPRELFFDPLAKELKEGWRWLGDEPAARELTPEGLRLRHLPGNAQTVKNALVREISVPTKGTLRIEVTLINEQPYTGQYEQAGFTWYHEGRPHFKFVKELVDGKVLIIPARKEVAGERVDLRLALQENAVHMEYRPGGEGEWLPGGSAQLPKGGKHEISLQCYHGPADAAHHLRFRDFRVSEISE